MDNTALKATGYKFVYPDFEKSMKQMGEWYKKEGRSCR